MKTRTFTIGIFSTIIMCVLILASCTKEERRLPYQVDAIFSEEETEALSKYLDIDQFTYVVNVTTAEQFQQFLGRVLFYDKNLSSDKSVSCESCHQQKLAFSDDKPFSHGVNGNFTERNSLPLGSFVSFSGHYGEPEEEDSGENSFFWDHSAATLEEQLIKTLANPNEMGMDLRTLEDRVANAPYTQILYEKAFPNESVNAENIVGAIADFVNSLESSRTSFDSALDKAFFRLTDDFPTFTESENIGKRLFTDNCASCHAFTLGSRFRHQFDNLAFMASNGLELEYQDKGKGAITRVAEDNGLFKIPGLRNVALTAPYMHDGRFATLEEVVEFYNEGVIAHPNLDEKLKDKEGAPKRLNMTEIEKKGLVDFLKTLTGEGLIQDESLSNPFKS